MTTTLAAILMAALASAMPAESLRLETQVPPEVRAGDRVPVTLRVTNVSARPVELYLMGRSPTFDVTVARADGGVVWRRLEGQTIPSILQVRVLAPGESLELHHEWDQGARGGAQVGAGQYTVRGSLVTDGAPLRTPAAPLRIVPRER